MSNFLTQWYKKSDRLEAAIPSLSPATLNFLCLVKYPTERLPRMPSWRDCAYECVITSVPFPTKVYLVRSKQSTGWSRAGSINQRHVWCVKNGRECEPEGKRAKLTQNRKTAFLFIIFIASSSFLNYPHFTHSPLASSSHDTHTSEPGDPMPALMVYI